MTEHPLNEWTEVTTFGEDAPRFILSRPGRETAIAKARELYATDQISLEEFEKFLDVELNATT